VEGLREGSTGCARLYTITYNNLLYALAYSTSCELIARQ
jgi:hypothetical protein